MSDLEKISNYRLAGNVRRVHTLRTQATYTVGQHSYDALSLLLLTYPGEPSMNLVRAVLWHDASEAVLGDMPAPAKWAFPKLAQAYKEAEKMVEQEKFPELHTALLSLTETERQWLSAVDALELLFWSMEEEASGNHYAVEISQRITGRLFEAYGNGTFPQPLMYLLKRVTNVI